MRRNVNQAFLFEKTHRRSEVKSSSKKANVLQHTRSLYSTLNIYFWCHGIGFEKRIACALKHLLETLLSFLIMILADGNSVITICIYFNFWRNGEDGKTSLSVVVFHIINLFNRISLYIRRKELKTSMKKLAEIYGKVEVDGASLKIFKWKLIFILLTHDIVACVVTLKALHQKILRLDKPLHTSTRPSYSLLVRASSKLLHIMSLTHTPFTAYFCSVCFVLKETLTALNRKLRHAKEKDLESLFDVHCEISHAVSNMNHFMDPHLLLTSSFILLYMFEEMYIVLFDLNRISLPVPLHMLRVSMHFLHFVLLCLFGSYVTDAAANLRATAQTLSKRFSQFRSLHLVSALKEGIEGFKMLSSIVIGKSLILTVICSFMSYGILIATLDTSKEAAGKN